MAARPVNLMRYEILRRVLAGEEVDAAGTERLQEAIVRREESAFPEYPDAFFRQLEATDIKANTFRNWQDHFRLFYPLFYSGKDRDRVPKFLEQILTGSRTSSHSTARIRFTLPLTGLGTTARHTAG